MIYYGYPDMDERVVCYWEFLSVLTLSAEKRAHFIFGQYVTNSPEKIARLIDEFFDAMLSCKASWDDEMYNDVTPEKFMAESQFSNDFQELCENIQTNYRPKNDQLSLTVLFEHNAEWKLLSNHAEQLLSDAELPVSKPSEPFNYAKYCSYSDLDSWWENIEEKQQKNGNYRRASKSYCRC